MGIVKVKWVDSQGLSPDWELKDGLEQLRVVYVTSVGFLLEDREDYITILQSDSDKQVLGRLTIPRGCVKNMDVLEQDN